VLCLLFSKPVGADMIRAFGRAHYVRYDESSATPLTEAAALVRREYGGDLRRLAERSNRDVGRAAELLQQFKGIGATGADIFLREIQNVWCWVRPYFDQRAVAAARDLGLPTDPRRLAALAPQENARLAAALVRLTLDDGLRQKLIS
jgi:hypothetical protein